VSKYLDRAREYERAIREILMREWDPIGVFGIPEAQDEYDSYVPHIYSQIVRHQSEQEIFQNLWEIETDHMGLCGNRQQTEKVAKLLIDLRQRIEEAH
jgi:hypothetical protein